MNLTSAIPGTDCGAGRRKGRVGWLIAAGILAAALLGWSGICVQMQVRAVAGELLSVGMFTCARVLQAAVMALGAFFLFR